MKTVCIDFDGVLSEYDGNYIQDVFGEYILDGVLAANMFYEAGWRVIIFTCRKETPAMRRWLSDNNVDYHGINTTDHNLPGCSRKKPFADVYLDDRAINFHEQPAKEIYAEAVLMARSIR